MKIVIVDYGLGNLKSLISALKYLGYSDVSISNKFKDLNDADKLILPGVGNYSAAIQKINEYNLINIIKELVLDQKKPILGICLGMQLMGNSSTEGGYNSGLKLIDAYVDSFTSKNFKIPHVGFNQVNFLENSRLYYGMNKEADFYFTHSYRMLSNAEIGKSICDYSEQFVASFEIENIAGVQFHPEISQLNGLKVLKNFIDLF